MIKYELIDDNIDIIVKLIRNGFMKVDVIKRLNIYENFQKEEGSRMERYKKVAEEHNLNASHVRKIIKELEKKAK